MENTPGVPVPENVGSMNLSQEGLALAVGEDGFAYIFKLQTDNAVPDQIMTDTGLEQTDALNMVDTKFSPAHALFPGSNFVQITTSSDLVLSSSACDTAAGIITQFSTVNCNDGLSVSTGYSDGMPPIEIQYLHDGVFIHEGEKCDVENLALEPIPDIKFDPIGLQSSDVAVDEAIDVSTKNRTNCELEAHCKNVLERTDVNHDNDGEKVEDSSLCQDVKPLPDFLAPASTSIQESTIQDKTTPLASKTVKTYGKPKIIKKTTPTSEASVSSQEPEVLSENINPPPPPKITSCESQPGKSLNVVRIADVYVKTPSRISIPIPPRKRRLIIDSQKQIPIPEFKRQLVHTKDIVHAKSDLCPGTRQAMRCLEMGGVAQFFSTPGRPIVNTRLSKLFLNNLTVPSTENSSFDPGNIGPLSADLKIPTIPTTENNELNSSPSPKKQASQPVKRLINVGKPLPQHIFRGLRKPPIFKEYKKIQRKSSTSNGMKKSILGAKIVGGCQASSAESLETPKTEEEELLKIEEVVYTVEDGESVVLKSHGTFVDQSPEFVQSCDISDNGETVVLKSYCSTENETIVQLVKVEETDNEFEESVLSNEDDNDDEPNTADLPFTITGGSTSDDYFKAYLDSETKTSDLQSEDSTKLWSFEVSSS